MLKESEARKLNMVKGIMVYLSNYLSSIYLHCISGNYVLLSALLYSAHVFYFHGHRVVSGAPTIISLFLLGYRRKRKKGQKVFPEIPPNNFHLYLTSHPSCQRAWERWTVGQLVIAGIKLKICY